MREILFRGKRTDNGEWVEGYYYKAKYCRTDDELCDYITVPHPKEYNEPSLHYIVNPETVGQYTGLKDKNGTKIFEGDIVKSCEYDDIYFVRYFNDDNYPAFDCVPDVPLCECNGLAFLVNTEGCEIIGNIHDNPELSRGDTNA